LFRTLLNSTDDVPLDHELAVRSVRRRPTKKKKKQSVKKKKKKRGNTKQNISNDEKNVVAGVWIDSLTSQRDSTFDDYHSKSMLAVSQMLREMTMTTAVVLGIDDAV
jgi:hypothetical protein